MVLYQKNIGTVIKKLRKEHSWSQAELATKCCMHRTFLGGVERGERNVTLSTLIKIAQALEKPLSELFKKAGL